MEIAGTVTNVSDETFTRINLHAFSSEHAHPRPAQRSPQSATIDPTLFVGDRVTVPGTFDTIDELAPGASATFNDSVPVELLATSGEPGVYWIGIHALGDSSVPRDLVADGRARTLHPPSGVRRRPATRGLGDPADPQPRVVRRGRRRRRHRALGATARGGRQPRRRARHGRLGRLRAVQLAGRPRRAPRAVARLAHGNPPRTLTPDPTVPGQEPAPVEPPTDGEESPTTPGETLTPTQPVPTEEPTRRGGAAGRPPPRRGWSGSGCSWARRRC